MRDQEEQINVTGNCPMKSIPAWDEPSIPDLPLIPGHVGYPGLSSAVQPQDGFKVGKLKQRKNTPEIQQEEGD